MHSVAIDIANWFTKYCAIALILSYFGVSHIATAETITPPPDCCVCQYMIDRCGVPLTCNGTTQQTCEINPLQVCNPNGTVSYSFSDCEWDDNTQTCTNRFQEDCVSWINDMTAMGGCSNLSHISPFGSPIPTGFLCNSLIYRYEGHTLGCTNITNVATMCIKRIGCTNLAIVDTSCSTFDPNDPNAINDAIKNILASYVNSSCKPKITVTANQATASNSCQTPLTYTIDVDCTVCSVPTGQCGGFCFYQNEKAQCLDSSGKSIWQVCCCSDPTDITSCKWKTGSTEPWTASCGPLPPLCAGRPMSCPYLVIPPEPKIPGTNKGQCTAQNTNQQICTWGLLPYTCDDYEPPGPTPPGWSTYNDPNKQCFCTTANGNEVLKCPGATFGCDCKPRI